MDKKNTLLLTVIAIATLLVAVVGATFAYFSAQVDKGQSTSMTVTTSSDDTLTYSGFKPLYIIANQTNFAQVKPEESGKVGSQKGVAEAVVELRAGGTAGADGNVGSQKPYCYNVRLDITANTFGYAPYDATFFGDGNKDQDKPSSPEEHAPELLLTISKDGVEYSNTIYYIETAKKGSLDEGDTTKTAVTYKEKLKQNRRVCTQSNVSASTGVSDANLNCEDDQEVKGYDVTELKNSMSILIPVEDNGNSNESTKTAIKHEIKGTGTLNETVKDEWKAELVFVNYDWDQQYNVGKLFTANWSFDSVSCETGDLLPAE